MKPVLLFAILLFSQSILANPDSPLAKDDDLQVLYSELKSIESATLRVEFTIEALEESLHETPFPEDLEDLYRQLGSLYMYYTRLDAYQRELSYQWNRLLNTDESTSVAFTQDQLKPIPITTQTYQDGLPEAAIPFFGFSSIPVK